ncbi:MAG: MFS transporter [Phycisphaerales bacterium]|nr:MFS transporter [Phycisphaerales bacterium]
MAHTKPEDRQLPGLLILNANFVLLWAAYGVSAIGDHLSEMAMLHLLGGIDRPDVTRLQALLTFGFFLPFPFLGPIAGWWADRFSRRVTMVVADLLRAGIVLNMGVIVVWILNTAKDQHWHESWHDLALLVPIMTVGALAAFFSPARQALLPTLIREDHLVRANAMTNALGMIGTIISALLGGYLVQRAIAGTFSLSWSFRLDAITFVISAALLSMINLRRAKPAPATKSQGVMGPILNGIAYVADHRRVWRLILLGAVYWAAAGAVISIIPALVRDIFGGAYQEAGLYRGLIGVGLVIGSIVMTVVGPTASLQLRVLSGLLGGAFWLAALCAASVFKLGKIFSALTLIGIGGAGAAIIVSVFATLQQIVPNSRRGRVFGVSDTVTMTALLIATGLLGLPNIPNLDRYVPWIILIQVALFLAALVVAWRAYRRGQTLPPITWLTLHLTRFYARFWCRMRRDGHCTIPISGPVIVAANHTAGVDPMCLIAASPHRLISFLVAEEHYRKPIANYFMRMVNCVPIDRANPGKSFLVGSLGVLKQGGCFGIFPQGTFETPDAETPDAKAGVGLLALRSGATVIPCHIGGTTYRDSPFLGLFLRHRVRLKFGPPVDLADFAGKHKDRGARTAAADRIMDAIERLAPPADSQME